MIHSSKGAQQKLRHVRVVSYHQLSAHDDSDETLIVGHMQALTLTLPTRKMLVGCYYCGRWKNLLFYQVFAQHAFSLKITSKMIRLATD